jgi:hypothetical protein
MQSVRYDHRHNSRLILNQPFACLCDTFHISQGPVCVFSGLPYLLDALNWPNTDPRDYVWNSYDRMNVGKNRETLFLRPVVGDTGWERLAVMNTLFHLYQP